MNRGYTSGDYRRKIDLLRKRCSNIAVSADCIVGFPGEDEKDFEETLRLVQDIRFDGLFSFCFSPRKYTAASALADRVAEDRALERLHRLQAVQKVITRERLRNLEGKKVEVLVEGSSKNAKDELTGRTRSNSIVNFIGKDDLVGKLVELYISRGYANSVRGENPTTKEV
jgi:tRNA-2-methylthio-N6-dimethylallyladenosine synthase